MAYNLEIEKIEQDAFFHLSGYFTPRSTSTWHGYIETPIV